jgi:hypothetical protein
MTNRLGILLLEFATVAPADSIGIARLTPGTIGPGCFHILVAGATPAATVMVPQAGLPARDSSAAWRSSAVWGSSAGWGGSAAWANPVASRGEN